MVQTTYEARMRAGLPGLVKVLSYSTTGICKAEGGIAFGIAVQREATETEQGVIPGVATAQRFQGVSIRDVTLDSRQEDKYADKQNVGILRVGEIWVQVSGSVAPGDAAAANTTTGVFGPAGDGMTAVPGGVFRTAAAQGEVALLDLRAENYPAAE